MKKVYQTIVDKGNGNCMQAATASILELELNEVPNFIDYLNDNKTNPHYELMKFLESKGFDYSIWTSSYFNGKGKQVMKQPISFTKEVLRVDGGINGFFYASVKSQTFEDVSHAVVIDLNMSIVHDPNPNQLALKLNELDILDIVTCGKNWYIDVDNKLKLHDDI